MGKGSVLVISIIFFVISLYLTKIRKNLIIETTMNNSGKAALVVSVLVLAYFVYRFGSVWYDYTVVLTGTLMTYCRILSGGITEKGVKSTTGMRSTTQIWEGISRVELSVEDAVKLSYVGNSNASVLYFKKEDYEKIVAVLNKNLGEGTKIILN